MHWARPARWMPSRGLSSPTMQRRLIALIVGTAVGLGAAAGPAMASTTLAASGDATSITTTSADLNGVVYRDRVGARWLFEYSANSSFDTMVASTTPVTIKGRLTAVERQVTGLAPDSTYYWRVVLVVRSGTRTAQTFGATKTLTTSAAAPATAATPASTPAPTTPAPSTD
jgi:phosphodiesterase/alkaline phosphatase D-like protein